MKEHIVIRTVSRLLIPFIQLFSLYVIAHGDISPGGGFQGGVIIGASIILYVISFGMEEGRRMVSEKASDFMNSAGAFLFAGIGVLCMLAGGAYLQYTALAGKAASGEHAEQALYLASHLGIYGIEIGIGITVAAVMITIFFETARHEDD